MQTHDLTPHPDYPPAKVTAIRFRIDVSNLHWIGLRWRIEGASAIVLPAFTGRRRHDGLWRSTCFELFVREPGTEAYAEWNLSPSQAWAAYGFERYREGMTDRLVERAPLGIWRGASSGLALFDANIARAELPSAPWQYQATAVIEEASGRKSYWAFAHGDGAPDFHDAACFTGELAAPHET